MTCLLPLVLAALLQTDEPTIVLWSLVKDAEGILEGTIGECRQVDAGHWHRVRIDSVLWGHDPGSTIQIFTHGSGTSETISLSPGQRYIFGVDWVSEEDGPFYRRLFESLDAGDGEWVGLPATDAFIPRLGSENDDLDRIIRRLTAIARQSGSVSQPEVEELLGRIADERAFVREVSVRLLTSRVEHFSPGDLQEIYEEFMREVQKRRQSAVLQSYLDLIRTKKLRQCHEGVFELVVSSEDVNLVNESIEALSERSSPVTLSSILSRYDDATARQQGRILKLLARQDWEGTVALCKKALSSEEGESMDYAVEALGCLKSSDASRLLEDCLQRSSARLRGLSIQSLARQKTETSVAVLRRSLDGSLSPNEKRMVRRALSGLQASLRRGSEN